MPAEKIIKVEMVINKLKSTTCRVGLAVSLLLGSAACVPIDSMIITPTPETSPLPSDVTPEFSPTEALVELTPKVTANPEPTARKTEMPIITLTPEPTPTETEALEDKHIF